VELLDTVTLNGLDGTASFSLWMSFEYFPYGVVVARGFASCDMQKSLLEYVLSDINAKTKADEMEEPSRRYSQLGMWNWPSRYGAMVGDDSLPSAPELVFKLASEFVAQVSLYPPVSMKWVGFQTLSLVMRLAPLCLRSTLIPCMLYHQRLYLIRCV
jgi:hypothetical protein